jgi:alkylhydroperoxidase/carboxymuconolactone decarboxylase family protein YurZ
MAVTNVSRAILYALSELGEVGTVSADNTTISSKKAIDNKTPVLASVSVAAAEAHVLSVHPQIGKIVG